jgi:16S rRNA (adenine1518-N6/adenine1519-N6)-dimethyltransferase
MGIKPLKHLGQNFLTDHGVIDHIVDSIQADPGMPLVEIGPGTGALTGRLRMRYPRYRAIEIDTRSVELLKKQHSGIDILQMDVLDPSWIDTLPSNERVAVIGNLPYYITSPIIFLLIDRRERFSEAVIMVQKEVAERLVATPGHREYGILSVQVQLAAHVELLFKVPNTAFHPVPKVESAVLRIVFDKPRPDVDPEHLRRVIRQAFSQKRKMLRNTLAPMLPVDKALPGWDLSRRAETLSLDEFVTLAKDLKMIVSH